MSEEMDSLLTLTTEEAKGFVLRELLNGQFDHVTSSSVVDLLDAHGVYLKPDKAIAHLILEDLAKQGFCMRHDSGSDEQQ